VAWRNDDELSVPERVRHSKVRRWLPSILSSSIPQPGRNGRKGSVTQWGDTVGAMPRIPASPVDEELRARRQHPAKGRTSSSTGAKPRRRDGFSSIGWNWSVEPAAELPSQAGSASMMDPTAAEVTDHLMKARVGIECLAINQSRLTCGPAFPHFEEASRSIHSALIAIQECTRTLGESSLCRGEEPRSLSD
jgi:hypothetical protein